MFETMLTASPWLALALALAFTAVDLALTVYERAYYYEGAKYTITVQGQQYRLDKPYRAAAGRRQFWTRRYTYLLVGTAVIVPLAWVLLTRTNNRPQAFIFAMGGLLMFEFVEITRLLRFIGLFRNAKRNKGMKGQLEVQGWVVNNLLVTDQYAFAVVFLLAYLASGSWFFLGGTTACFLFGRKLRDYVAYGQIRKA